MSETVKKEDKSFKIKNKSERLVFLSFPNPAKKDEPKSLMLPPKEVVVLDEATAHVVSKHKDCMALIEKYCEVLK